MPEPIYLDHSATTPVRAEVLEAMLPFFGARFGNPSSTHRWGREARVALDEARERLARALGASADEICFTSGGTEADNLAVLGAWRALRQARPAVVSTPIEHKAVLAAVEEIEAEGGMARLVDVGPDGVVDQASFDAALRDDTALCSVMWVNNEIGTVQDIATLAGAAKARGALFHTDGVQALGKVAIDTRTMPVDYLSISGHKVGAPKGIGALFVRRGAPITPLLYGGTQDRGRRPGTENVAMSIGFARAVELAVAEREAETARLRKLRDELEAAPPRQDPRRHHPWPRGPARSAHHEHLGPRHGQRVDAHGARPPGRRVFSGVRLPEWKHRSVARARGASRAARASP